VNSRFHELCGSVPYGNKVARSFILKNTRTSTLNFASTATSVVLSGTEKDLKSNGYTFIAKAGVDDARFYLKYQKTLGINPHIQYENNVMIYKSKGVIHIKYGVITIDNVKLYDSSGRFNSKKNNAPTNDVSIESAIYGNHVLIVKITLENQKVITKKITN